MKLSTTPAPNEPVSTSQYDAALARVKSEIAASRQAQRAAWAWDLQRLASYYFDGDLG